MRQDVVLADQVGDRLVDVVVPAPAGLGDADLAVLLQPHEVAMPEDVLQNSVVAAGPVELCPWSRAARRKSAKESRGRVSPRRIAPASRRNAWMRAVSKSVRARICFIEARARSAGDRRR